MLTPMMIQYLVGLCCWRHDPDAIDITIGDMVNDPAAQKERDVDVTITIKNANGTIEAFKAAEVKAEKKPLDVAVIEQLCIKLTDMPQVTHKSVFSTSGYTDGAISKAKTHSVELYTIMPWEKPIKDNFFDFPEVGTPGEFLSSFESGLLYWVDYSVYVVSRNGPLSFSYQNNIPVFTSTGKKHGEFADMNKLIQNILMRSTDILYRQEPASTILKTFPYGIDSHDKDYLVGPTWPHTHTIDVSSYETYLKIENDVFRIDNITISGHLQWRARKIIPEFFILKNVFDQKIFAGAAIAEYGTDDGRMCVITFPERGRTLGIHPSVVIPEKQRNKIRELKILAH